MTDHNLKKLLPLGTSLLRGTTFTDTITRKGKSHLRRTQIGDRVSVYRNLHLDNKFSIRAMDGEYRSKVMGYATCIILEEINFFVGKGIHKARAEKQRNVHAFVRGRFLDAKDTAIELPDNMVEISYNPFLYDDFFIKETKQLVSELSIPWAVLQNGSIFIPPPEDQEEISDIQ